jgi:fructokinase
LGENGAFGFSNEGERVYVPGYKVVLADPLGSGDAFSAGFVHRILGGASFAAACEFGNVLGSLAATKPGATAEISHDEIAQFLEEPRERNINSRLAEYQI